jgi:predicted RNA binding protein YcfA (HicA-like mRNA interferase family)
MPRKVRNLIRDLELAGFTNRGGKGSHRNFVHPKVEQTVTISGREGQQFRNFSYRSLINPPDSII